MTKAWVKYWKDPITAMTTLKKMVGEIMGMVILKKRWKELAPSMEDASYSSSPTPCRPLK